MMSKLPIDDTILAEFARWICLTPTLFEGDDIIKSKVPFSDCNIHFEEAYHGNPRLGFLYQHLCEVLFELNCNTNVAATELQLNDNGKTVGELDFIIDDNVAGELQHWEVAIKFYLLYKGKWYGPNARDRLDKKLRHMLQKQLQHTRNPLFYSQYPNWKNLSQHLLMQGRLYINPFLDQPIPTHCEHKRLNASQIKGHWCFRSQAHRIKEKLYPLTKPLWAIGRREFSGELTEIQDKVIHCETQSGQFWFIVPDHWPNDN